MLAAGQLLREDAVVAFLGLIVGMFLARYLRVDVDMNRGKRPSCIGMYGAEDECQTCDWRRECQETSESIDSAVTRKGTHVRIVSKYTEKKYKPKRV
jgi:hypothetical protein